MIKKNIPNFFTLCNLLCGCSSIVFAFQGDFVWSAYMVGIACIFDFADGLAARLLNVSSEIGKQLDSLADMVSFGAVPGAVMFQMMNDAVTMSLFGEFDNGQSYRNTFPGGFEPLLGFLITIFSAIRLAKFNLDNRQTNSFIGLPTPANTIFISSLSLFFTTKAEFNLFEIDQFIRSIYFLIPLTFISSFLLVAPLPLFALKFKNFSWADNKVRYLFLLLSLALLIIFKFAGIPLIIILYIVLSIINNVFARKTVQ